MGLAQFARRAAFVTTSMTLLAMAASDVTAQPKPPAKAADSVAKKSDAMSHEMSGMGDMKGMNHMMPGKKESMPSSGWKELDAFHALMQATWHPADEYGDIAPIRAKAPALASAAKALAASTPPTRCTAPNLVETAKALAPQTRTVAEMVKRNATNNQIKDSLKALHERFEVLEMGCGAMPKAASPH